MGVAIKDLVDKKDITISELKGKILVVDGYNNLYQYLSSIRQRDGSLLTDSKGRTTSHLVGIFSRTTKLMSKGIKIAFVFDGEAPSLKSEERIRRAEIKRDALKKYQEAKKKEDIDEMRKYASRTSILNKEMVEEAKNLLKAMGIPVIQAPAEGEAQAAYIVKKGDAFAVVSQDYDSFVYGATRVVQDLNISAKKKKINVFEYEKTNPKLIILSEMMNNLGIDYEQLIALSILVGTDYNIGGIKGIGPKTALKMVKHHGKDFDALFNDAKWENSFNFSWKHVFNTIKNMPVSDDYNISWKSPDEKEILRILVEEHDFSSERVKKTIDEMKKNKNQNLQKGLGDFF